MIRGANITEMPESRRIIGGNVRKMVCNVCVYQIEVNVHFPYKTADAIAIRNVDRDMTKLMFE